ncbi:hypothetical protein CQW23_22783 [Capsicum baccatum]|uniref:Uncharacterized protein n=1 Tax=Capsicum baccatum TaxID=33114 RepID=A0A2G2W1V1_CAPBA|nr:hypothetical protein CQW23_22783 [Capsicum baccatum]
MTKEEKILKKQLTYIQKRMRFLRYLYGTEINGCVGHEKLKGLRTQIQLMAENVGHFYLSLFGDEDHTLVSYCLCLIVLVELEMKKIFCGELKASKFTQSKTFREKKLPKGFSHHLNSLLVYLRNKKLKNFASARNIDVVIEFLLVFLCDVPNHVIKGKRLNEVLAKIGVVVGDILSVIKEDANKIDDAMIQILEKIEDLKADAEERYKSLKYSPSNEFPTVGGLSFLDSFLRKLNDMLKSESKMLQRDTVKLAYKAEVSIDSILVQCNALSHFFGSLPAIIKESKQILAKVKEMRFQNLPLKPFSVAEPSKHLPTHRSNPVNDEEIVGFENNNNNNKPSVFPPSGVWGG